VEPEVEPGAGPAAAREEEPASAEPPPAETVPTLAERACRTDVGALARELGVGELLLRDMLNALTRPGRDPRDDLPPPVFRREVMKFEHLQPGMELTGTVLNVVDFGAFVDIGLPDSGLIHISRLADRYVRDPHEVVSVGDILNVWVVDVDKQRRRVSLSALKPGTERAVEARPERPAPPPRESRPSKPDDRRAEGRRGGGKAVRPGAKPKSIQRPAKPAPVRPITDAMVEGKEPMRSFSDLLQFYEKKSGDQGKKK
jgi:uncharacterized protein